MKKTFKQLGYAKTPTIIDMIKSCENKSDNMFKIHKSELRRIKTRYYRKKQISPNQLYYLQLLYTNFVLKGMKLNSEVNIVIKKNSTPQHIGMKVLQSMNQINTCKSCVKPTNKVYCSEKCYIDND